MSEDKTEIRSVQSLYQASGGHGTPYLVVVSGSGIGRAFRLDKSPVVVGRSPRCHLILDEDGVSRQHVAVEQDGEGGLTVRDLGSTNGSFVNGMRVGDRAVPLTEGDRIQVGSTAVLRFSFQDELEEQFQMQLYRAAVGDPVTGLYNTKYFLERLEQEHTFCSRHERPLTVALMDVDGYSAISDLQGTGVGEQVLAGVAQVLRSNVRAEDLLARGQGDGFLLLLRECDADESEAMVRRLLERVAEQPLDTAVGAMRCTLSAGVSSRTDSDGGGARELLRQVEEAHARAAGTGRGSVGRYGS